jgi:RHS repeat-associated protein
MESLSHSCLEFHPEYLNTPRLISDSTGTPVWKWDQAEPFGVNIPEDNPSALGAFEFPLRFPGQYADKESGLAYNYFRDFDSTIGRYAQSDPVGLKAGLNTYAYVASASLQWSDKFGLAGEGSGFSTRYGNWCGRNWSGGREGRLIP